VFLGRANGLAEVRGGAVSSGGYLVTSALPAAGQHLVGGGSIGEDRFGSSVNRALGR
jgi:hypothetical protein